MGSRRASARNDDDEDCKAIYLSIYNDLDARIKSKEDLVFAIQQTGRNPTSKQLNSHWKPSTRFMTFDDFLNVCRRLPVTTQDDLMKAFRKMDANGDGYISRKEFMDSMTSRGEKMSMNEVIDIIERVDENGDGKLDYKEFCNLILSNVEDCKTAAKRKMTRSNDSSARRKESSRDIFARDDDSDEDERKAPTSVFEHERIPPLENFGDDDDDIVIGTSQRQSPSRTLSPPKKLPPAVMEEDEDDDDDIIIGSSHTSLRSTSRSTESQMRKQDRIVFNKTIDSGFDDREPRNIRRWTRVSRRGSLFLEDIGNNTKAVLSHMYSFSLSKPTHVVIKMSPLECKSLDISAPDLNVLLVHNGKPLTFGNQTSPDGRVMLRGDLQPGDYRVYPITSGAKFKPRSSQPRTKAKLLKKDREDRLALTTACKDALSDIFKMVDLDGNGYLNKEEFSLYIMRTSGEKLEEGLWEVVEENCNLVRGEITEEDFIKLNLKEAEQDNGDTENLWITLDSMGFNHQLFLDEAFPFIVEFFVEEPSIRLKVNVTEMDLDAQTVADKALVSYAIQNGDARDLPGAPSCTVAFLATRCGAVAVAENRMTDSRDIKVRSGIWIDVNCAESENLILGGANGSLKTDLNLKPNRSEIIFWLVPKEMKSQWKISCEVKKRS